MNDIWDEYDPINCPNCGRFMGWDAYDEEFTCSCGGSECIKHPDRPGWITIRKKQDHKVHEYRKAVTGHYQSSCQKVSK